MTARPDCLAPTACEAIGSRHCRRCSMSRALAARSADPHWRQRLSLSAKAVQRNPAVRAAQTASRRANKPGLRRVSANAKVQIATINADPAVIAKRAAAIRATKAAKLAEQHGFPVVHVVEFRWLRDVKELEPKQAVAVLRASYPTDFVAIDEAALLARRRAARPMPAPGMNRAEWIRGVRGETEGPPCV